MDPHSIPFQQNDSDQVLAELVERLADELRSDPAFDIEAFLALYPVHAEALRQLWPAVLVLADVGRSHDLSVRPRSTPTDDATVSGVLGDFRILREIGRGGMGIVYEAEQISLGRRVALKVLPFAALLDQRALQRFKNEALAAAQLDHPNIVDIYGVGCERGVHYYSMRLIDGQTLAEVIGQVRSAERGVRSDLLPHSALRTPHSAPEPTVDELHDPTRHTASALPPFGIQAYCRAVAELGVAAAEALHHAHEQGVIHRDIKPSNLMLDARGKLWITDFGLARLEAGAAVTMTGDMLGTLRYIEPRADDGRARRTGSSHRHLLTGRAALRAADAGAGVLG